MVDFATARRKMVDNQIRTNDVTSYAVQDAMEAVPREAFLPADQRPLAYIDEDLPLNASAAGNRFLMKPAQFAKMLQAIELKPDDVALVIGCGTGYSAAVMSRIAGSVVALESDEALAATGGDVLLEHGIDNVAVVIGPLAEGWKAEGPYDAIFVEGAVEELPNALFDQLKNGGRLIVVEGYGNAAVATVYTRSDNEISGRVLFNASVKPLPGFEKKPEFVF